MTDSISSSRLRLTTTTRDILIRGQHYNILFDKNSGGIRQVELFDGINWNAILNEDTPVGLNENIPVKNLQILREEEHRIDIEIIQEDGEWRITTQYEIHARGYVFATFVMQALADAARAIPRKVAVSLDENTVFSRSFQIINADPTVDMRQYIRGISVNFTTDERPVTNSVDFLLESVVLGMNEKPPIRFIETKQGRRELGWHITCGWPYPYSKGYRYRNRWCLSFTSLNPSPNPVRGQRIYHWHGSQADDFACPSETELLEMSEYGCSILIMHLPMLTRVDTREFRHPGQMREMVKRAHALGIKVLVYATPYNYSRFPQIDENLLDKRTECLNVWHAHTSSQIVSYEPNFNRYDCDELNLRCEEAFQLIKNNTIDCHNRYGLDGLYIDFAWPAQGLAKDPAFPDSPGIFNFYDYLRLMREWREAIGPNRLMIGHGGGFLVGSDMIEGFDACLTGEAQKTTLPDSIGQQYGTAPTLWIVQRSKKDFFRSETTIENCIREGLTPHVGLVVGGKAIIANMDPAHFPACIALWQMWRAFPMDRARIYNYLTETVLTLDNEEISYSLFLTPEQHLLLIIANTGGPRLEDSPSIGVNIELDIQKLGLPATLRCWRMKGNTYETFRIAETDPIHDGKLSVYEIDHHEFIGYILSPDTPPDTLPTLQKHLEGRFDRLPHLLKEKQKRFLHTDRAMDQFAKLPHAHQFFSYQEFMQGRIVE